MGTRITEGLKQEMGAVTLELGSEVAMGMIGSSINRGIITMRIGLPGYPTEHHTGPLHWWGPANWTVRARIGVCGSTHVFQRVRHKAWVLRGPLHQWNIQGGGSLKHAGTSHLKWSTVIVFTMPTMKNKAECLVSFVRFWRPHILYLGILPSPWHGLRCAPNRNGSTCDHAPWATWSSRPYELGNVDGRKDSMLSSQEALMES